MELRDALLERWQEQGDRVALGELLRSEVTTIEHVLRARGTATAALASDIAHDAVARLLVLDERGRLPRFEDADRLRGYLLRTAWNLCAMRHRRAGGRSLSLDSGDVAGTLDEASTSGGIEEVERLDDDLALRLSLEVLDPRDRRILRAFYLDGEPLAEIAASLGQSPEAVRARKMRALRRLSRRLRGRLDASG